MGLRSAEQEVARLNQMLVGWANYFCLGGVSKAYRAVDTHTRWRLRQWLRRKHKKQGSKGTRQFPDQFPVRKVGAGTTDRADSLTFRGRKRKALSESRMRENRTSGSTSGMWKRSMDELVRHRQTKGSATDRLLLHHRATSRLY